MAVQHDSQKLTEAELYAPDLDEDGELDVERYSLPSYDGDDPYLAEVWGAAKELIEGPPTAKQLSEGLSAEDFDSEQLAEGQKVEMEHTDDPEEAQRIAMDHLVEDPRYYSKLRLIESKRAKSSGTCKPGQTAATTGCTPASGGGAKKRNVTDAVLASIGEHAVSAKVAAEDIATRIGQAAWDKLSASVKTKLVRAYRVAKAIEHKVMVGFRKINELAVAVARERGLNEQQTAILSKALAVTDAALAWTINMPVTYAATGSATAAKAASWVPVASIGYLTYSTARSPTATLRAARKLVSGTKVASRKAYEQSGYQQLAEGIADRMLSVADPDLWFAAYCVAVDEFNDPDEAIAVADSVGKRRTKALQDPVLAAMARIGHGASKFVSLADLGQHLGGSPQSLHRALLQLWREGAVSLSAPEGRFGSSDSDRRWWLEAQGEVFGYVELKG